MVLIYQYNDDSVTFFQKTISVITVMILPVWFHNMENYV